MLGDASGCLPPPVLALAVLSAARLGQGQQELSWKGGNGKAGSDWCEDGGGTGIAEPGLLGLRGERSVAACQKSWGVHQSLAAAHCFGTFWFFSRRTAKPALLT